MPLTHFYLGFSFSLSEDGKFVAEKYFEHFACIFGGGVSESPYF